MPDHSNATARGILTSNGQRVKAKSIALWYSINLKNYHPHRDFANTHLNPNAAGQAQVTPKGKAYA